jgi:hypothetical protein
MSALAWALVLAAFATGLAASRLRRGPWLVPLSVAAAVLALLPLRGGLPLAGYLGGLGGEPSVTSLLLCGALLVALAGGPDVLSRKELFPLAFLVVSGAVFVYPMALGLTRFDPYALGYRLHASWLVAALGLVALGAALAGRGLVVACVLAAVAGWRFGLGESTNLWDYILDPWLSLGAVVWLARYLRSSARSPNLRKQSHSLP